MANLIQALVYQIDGNPLPSPITLDFQVSDILVREASINIPAVNSAIQVYNVPNNELGFKTYYAAESVSSLTALANTGSTSLTQATVLEVGTDPQAPGGFQYSFPSQEIVIAETINLTTGVNATITYKAVNYGVAETQAYLYTNSNISGFVLNEQGVPAFYADTLANIPAPGEIGRMFVSTDTFALYRDTGSSWDLIGGPGAGTVTGSGASGQVSFWNGASSLTGSNNLFWNAGANFLGIGTAGPSSALDVRGVITVNTNGIPSTISTRYGANSGGNNIWIGGGGQSSIGASGQPLLGSVNTSLGVNALFQVTTGYRNVAVGYQALFINQTGISNVAVGALSLQSLVSGSFNTAVGYQALTNATASNNSAFGSTALFSNTSGAQNVAVGNSALGANTNGSNNVAVGFQALQTNSTFSSSVAIGAQALSNSNQGNFNTAIGASAAQFINTGGSNIFIGYNCATTIVGAGSFTNSNSSIYIGENVIASGNGITNEIVLGNGATGRGTNTVTIGTSTTTSSLLRGEISAGTLAALGSAATTFLVANINNVIKSRTASEVKSDIGLANAVTGTGTTNYHTKFTGTSTIGNSLIQDNGSQIGYNAAPNLSYSHNFGSIGSIVNFETGTNGRIRIASSFATDCDGFVFCPFGNFIFGTNIYYNQPSFYYDKNGYGVYVQMEATTGTFNVLTAPLNSGGAGAIATPVGRFTIFNSGNAVINKLVDAGWKLDIAATTNGLRVTGGGTTSATTGLRVETSGGTGNLIVLDNGNIGIRESAPAARLHIATGGATTASLGLKVRNSADSVDILSTFGTTQVIINSTSASLAASAQLQIDSTTRGFLPPRMTNASMLAIVTPAAGLIVYDTTNNKLNVYDGTSWVPVH